MNKNRTFAILALVCALLLTLTMSAGGNDRIKIRTSSLTKDSLKVWVFFKDKGNSVVPLSKRVAVNDKATTRRALRGSVSDFDEYDREVNPQYVAQVEPLVKRVANKSRWLNAVSAWVTPSALSQLAELSFVESVTEVAVFHRKNDSTGEGDSGGLQKPQGPFPPDYGESYSQAAQIEVDQLHDRGYHGEGMTILMLDSGFKIGHSAFAETDIDSTWDFINGDVNVDDSTELMGPSQAAHGTSTLSIIGGYEYGQMIGVAYQASFLLAKTEVIGSETEIEEDNWVAGIEWGEALGADVASSSLGYNDWYTWEDMDGHTAVTTRGAMIAARHGLIICNSAGNEGHNADDPPSIIAPADGDSVIAVGAVDIFGEIAGFSSNGPTFDGRIKPDLCARGAGTWLAYIPSSAYPTGYGGGSGTSYSAPLVAGACALLLQAHPNWRYGELYQALTRTASQAGSPDNLYGYGIVRAYQAFNYGSESDTAVTRVIAAPNPFTTFVDFLFSLSAEGDVTYRVYTVAGEKVAEKTKRYSAPGDGDTLTYRITWEGANLDGKQVAPGVYVVYFKGPGIETVFKIFRKDDEQTF